MNADSRQARSAATRSYGSWVEKAEKFLGRTNEPGDYDFQYLRDFNRDLTAILMGAPLGVDYAEARRQQNTVVYDIDRKLIDKVREEAKGIENFTELDWLGTKDVKTTQPAAAPIQEQKVIESMQEIPTTPKPKKSDTGDAYPSDPKFDNLRNSSIEMAEVENNANIEQIIVTPKTNSSREYALVEVAQTPQGFVNRYEFQTKTGGSSAAAMYYYLQSGPYFATKQEAINAGLTSLRSSAKKF